MKTILTRFLIAQSFAFLCFTPYAFLYTDGGNRFLFQWRFLDGIEILLASFMLGSVFFLIYSWSIKQSKRWIQSAVLLGFYLFFAAVGCLTIRLSLVRSHLISEVFCQGAWEFLPLILSIPAVLIVYFWRRGLLKKIIRTVCLALSPLPAVFLVSIWGYSSKFHFTPRPLPSSHSSSASANDGGTNAYVFIFDEWSYERSFQDGKLIPAFKRLSAACESMMVFHRAYTPHPETILSFPSFLFATPDVFRLQKDCPGFVCEGKWTPMSEKTSIFRKPKDAGYFTAMIGLYLPYHVFLGKDVHACYTHSWSGYKSFSNQFHERMGAHFFKALYCLQLPSLLEYPEWVLRRRNQLRFFDQIHSLAMSIIENQSRPTFAVFHYPIPHDPFVFDADGPRSIFEVRGKYDVPGYLNNLAFLDRVLGEIIQTLKKAGKFDSSLLIFTTDHSWRWDPKVKNKKHGCLFIKLPGQERGAIINEPVEIYRFGLLVQRCLSNSPPPDIEKAVAMLRKGREKN